MENTETKGKVRVIMDWTKKHKMSVVIILFVIITLVLALRLRSSSHNQTQLEQKYEEQAKQLEQQNLVISALSAKNDELEAKKSIAVISSDTIKQQLNSLSDLVTQQYIYTNADKKESSEKWLWGVKRPLSGKTIIITYDGIIKAGIDLSKIDVDVNNDKRTITVTLPASRITDNNIPQESIETVEVKDGLFNKVTVEDYNDFISEQKPKMEQKAIDQGLLVEADKEAKSAVRVLLSSMPGIGDGDEEGEYKLIIK